MFKKCCLEKNKLSEIDQKPTEARKDGFVPFFDDVRNGRDVISKNLALGLHQWVVRHEAPSQAPHESASGSREDESGWRTGSHWFI